MSDTLRPIISNAENPFPGKAIFVSHFIPSAVGNGGNHRAYQIAYDLAQCVKKENLRVIAWPEWRESVMVTLAEPPIPSNKQQWGATARRIGRRIPPLLWAVRLWRKTGIRPWLRRVRQRWPFLAVEHPLDLLVGQASPGRYLGSPEFVAYYREQVADLAGKALCIIEHPGFAPLLSINHELGIPTIACVQNIEAFDTTTPFQVEQPRAMGLAALSFVDEFSVWAQCDARLFISKVEAGLAGGLGLTAHYYPYRPVGEIRTALEALRERRQREGAKPGLFVMVGSAGHTTTARSFKWFIQEMLTHGLPEGVHVVVCGSRTETLLPVEQIPSRLELRGWVEQAELESLLCQAQAVLVPQTLGFGALTRIPELSLAGIPVIMSQHPAYALDVPPGVRVVDDSWDDWLDAMLELMDDGIGQDPCLYVEWERKQCNTLQLVMKRLLNIGEIKDGFFPSK